MIEINLLPAESRAVKKQQGQSKVPDVRRFLYVLPVIFGLIVVLHIYLAALTVSGNAKLRAAAGKWQAAAAQRKELEDFNKKYALLSENIETMRSLDSGRVAWAEKLQVLSSDLPAGIWFRGLSLQGGNFTLEGSALSLEQEGMNQIKDFIESLKGDQAFFSGFENLELASVQRRALGNYSVVDFTISGKLKG